MTKGETMYYRLCEGLKDKGKLIPDTENVYKYIKDTKKDYYVSLYKYNESQKKTFEQTGSVAGMSGLKTNNLVFDFDSPDLSKAQSDTKELVKRLKDKKIPEDAINVYFSGNKGFHVTVLTDKYLTSQQTKKIAKNLSKGLTTFDSVIYNDNRIIRVPNTKHAESGFFKTPISIEELNTSTVNDIKEIAKSEYEPQSVIQTNLPPLFLEIAKTSEDAKTPTVKESKLLSELDLTKRPKWLSPWKYALSQGYFPPGQRSNALMILGATYKSQGLPPEVTYRMLKGVIELQSQRHDQEKFDNNEIWTNVINTIYNDSWQGKTYSEDNFPQAIQDYLEEMGVPRKDDINPSDELIERVDQGFGDFYKYAVDIDKYTMSFGIPSLDKKLKIRKGHLIYLLAPPGVGKTSFAVTLLNNMSKEGTHCYFGSYDMYKNNVYQKLIQRHTGLSEEGLYDVFRNNDQEKIKGFREILTKNYGNVTFCFKSGQSIGDIKKSIHFQEQQTNQPIDLVMLDYLELIQTQSKDPTQASAEAAQGLREIANEGRVVVCLLQPNKMNSKPNEPALSYNAAKGSSTIAQSATAILTAHRPGMNALNNNEYDKYFCINCVKNRNGSLFSADFAWHGPTQTIREMEDIERRELKELRDLIKMEKEEDKFDI